MKILLIEHDAGFTRSVREMLTETADPATELASAPSLHEAFSELQQNQYDAVIADLSVPDGAGLGNILLLKAGLPQLPVIAAGDSNDQIIKTEAIAERDRMVHETGLFKRLKNFGCYCNLGASLHPISGR